MHDLIKDPSVFAKLKAKLHTLKQNCLKCGGKGYVLTDENSRTFKDCDGCSGKIEKYREFYNAHLQEDMMDVNLGDLKSILTTSTYDAFSEIVDKVTRLIEKYQIIVYLADESYSFGTTSAVSIIIKELVLKNFECYCMTFDEMVDVHFNFDRVDSEEDKRKLQKLNFIKSVPVLGITNFGETTRKVDGANFTYKKIADFLNIRRIHGHFTVIGCEMTKGALYGKYAGAVSTMLEQQYLSFILQCHDGKHKHSAQAKLGREDPELAKAFADRSDNKVINIDPKKKVDVVKDEVVDESLDNVIKDRTNRNVRNQK